MDAAIENDVAAVGRIKGVSSILDVVCHVTGMRFAAVARVTENIWVACSVRDEMGHAVSAGTTLDPNITICDEIRSTNDRIVIANVSDDPVYCNHHVPKIFGIASYIAVPIRLVDKSFWGTLCAVDPEPRPVKDQRIIDMFEMFAEIIGYHLSK